MFTGIVEQLGVVQSNLVNGRGRRLTISANFHELIPGESFSINGVCLSLLPGLNDSLSFDVSSETSRLTTVNYLDAGDKVNIERALKAHDRMGGHYVSGHVDTTAKITRIKPEGDFCAITLDEFEVPGYQYTFPKGSITVDGVSLTINTASASSVGIMLIPHTLANTSLGMKKIGDTVNIEFDYLSRAIAHQVKSIVQSQSADGCEQKNTV